MNGKLSNSVNYGKQSDIDRQICSKRLIDEIYKASECRKKYIMELFVIAVSVLTEKISAPVKVKLYRMRKTGNKQEDTKI